MPAAAATSAPAAVGAPTTVSPSDRSTIAAGGASSPSASGGSVASGAPSSSFGPSALSVSSVDDAPNSSRIVPVVAIRASPIAVPSSSSNDSIDCVSLSRSSVGGTRNRMLALKLVNPISMDGFTASTKSSACAFAASKRFGSTSSACMDSETSNTSMMIERSSAGRSSRYGWARPNTPMAKPASSSAVTRWRGHAAERGITESRSSMFVNRAARRRRIRMLAT